MRAGIARALGLLVALGGAAALPAAAASLALSTGTLGAGSVGTSRCTAAALTVIQTLSGASVASVTVGGLPAACGGGTLQVTVNNGVTSGSGSAAVPAGGGSVTVTLGIAPAAVAAAETDLVVVGP
jgi:hypothetical protein